MVYGRLTTEKYNHTKDITQWTKNQDMAYISGKMHGLIKEISITISVTVMDNYMMEQIN